MQLEQRRGATRCFSSHILSDVEDICDSYAVIDHGVLLEHGSLAELLGQAPLLLIGQGTAPERAEETAEGWQWLVPEDQRAAALAEVQQCGGELLRMERQRQALEDYFVKRVAGAHKASQHVASPATTSTELASGDRS